MTLNRPLLIAVVGRVCAGRATATGGVAGLSLGLATAF
jgi:hypothetical protein